MAQIALTSDQLDSLRGTTSVASRFVNRLRISACPNVVKYSMRVNQASFGNSYAQITYDGGSGTLANVKPGMRVIIAHTNDIQAGYWEGIVRKTPGASTLYVNETSLDLSDNDYIWIVDDFPIKDKLARQVSGVQYNFYDIAFRQLLPVVYNLKTVYAGDISSSILTLSFAPLALAATSGATISTWAWDVGDGTITVGSSSTQNITATFPEGHRFIHLTVTDSGGRAVTRHIEIHAHGSTYTYQLVAVTDVQITRNVGTGDDGSLTNYVGVTSLLDNTQITIWSDDTYQTGDAALTGDNIIFIGRIRTRENTTSASDQYVLDKSAAYTLEGALTQLARTEQLPFEMLNVASPAKWGDIKNLTIWRGIVYLLSEYSTFLELYSLTFDSTADTFLAPTRNPSGDILAAVNDLALSINAALQIDPSGHAEVVRNAVMQEVASDRNALATRANITTADVLSVTLRQDGARPVGLLTASGGSLNSTTGLYTISECLSPGFAQDYGSQTAQLARQVLPANLGQAATDAKLKLRANNALEKAQEVDKIDATFTPGWYSALIPSLNTWYTFTLAAEVTVDGAVTSKTVLTSATRWLLVNVDLGLNADGIPEVKGSFIRETSGIMKGFTVVYPPPTSPTLPSYPTDPTLPMFPVPPVYLPPTPEGDEVPVPVSITLPLDGNAWVVMGTDADSAQSLRLTTTMLQLASPYTREIVPTDLTATEVGKDIKINPYAARGLYALYYDTDANTSSIRYTADCTAYPVIWSQGEIIDGEFTELRIKNAAGVIQIFGPDPENSGWSHDFDFTIDNQGWSATVDTAYSPSTLATDDTGVTGWKEAASDGVAFPANRFTQVTIEIGWAISTTITGASFEYDNLNEGNDTDPDNPQSFFYIGIEPPVINSSLGAGSGSTGWGGSPTSATSVKFSLDIGFRNDSVTCTGTGTIVRARLEGTGNNPFGSGGALSKYSDDYGATFDADQSVDSDASWIDAAKASNVSLAGGSGQTRTAASGGAWSDYGDPKASAAGVVPRFHLTTTSSNSGSNPQHLIFADTLDSGESMFVVSSNGTVFDPVSPDDGSDVGLATGSRSLNVQWQSSGLASHILAIGLFDATVKLAVSLDTGTTWKCSSALDPDSFGIVTQRGSQRVAGFANGNKVAIVKNYQAASITFVERELGFDEITSLDVFG